MEQSNIQPKTNKTAVAIFIAVVVVAIAALVALTLGRSGTSTNAVKAFVMVPQDLPAYEQAVVNAMNEEGGTEKAAQVANAWTFVRKDLASSTATTTEGALFDSAEAAAELIPTQASVMKPQIAYLKAVDGTAYVLSVINIDGWAGVSFSIAQVQPVIEKTLLAFPGIKSVKFGVAPGDSIEDVQKQYNALQQEREAEENAPHIDSISPASGPTGTLVTITGRNLAGLEGDLDVTFEDSNGNKVGLVGDPTDYPKTGGSIIHVKAQAPCKLGETVYGRYSGNPSTCDIAPLKPGTYKVYATPWGKMSNEVYFNISSSNTSTDLRTYANSQYGYSLQVPKASAIEETASEDGWQTRITMPDNNYTVRLLIDTTDAPATYDQGCNTASGSDSKTIVINGQSFNSVDVSRLMSAGVNTSARQYCTVLNNGVGYSMIAEVIYGDKAPVNADDRADLNAAIYSFKFAIRTVTLNGRISQSANPAPFGEDFFIIDTFDSNKALTGLKAKIYYDEGTVVTRTLSPTQKNMQNIGDWVAGQKECTNNGSWDCPGPNIFEVIGTTMGTGSIIKASQIIQTIQ